MTDVNIHINNIINYDGEWISEFINLLYLAATYLCSFDEDGYVYVVQNLRWQQIHGDGEYDRGEIEEAIEIVKGIVSLAVQVG